MDGLFFLILNLLAEFTKNIFSFAVTTRRISSSENRSNTVHGRIAGSDNGFLTSWSETPVALIAEGFLAFDGDDKDNNY